MKAAAFTIAVLLYFFASAGFAAAHLEEYILVERCPPQEHEVTVPHCLEHHIKKGETLSGIAHSYTTKQNKVTVSLLKKINPSLRGDGIIAGHTLLIPYVYRADLEQAVKLRALESERQALEEENLALLKENQAWGGLVIQQEGEIQDFTQEMLLLRDQAYHFFLKIMQQEGELYALKVTNAGLNQHLDGLEKERDVLAQERLGLLQKIAEEGARNVSFKERIATLKGEQEKTLAENERLTKELSETTKWYYHFLGTTAAFAIILFGIIVGWLFSCFLRWLIRKALPPSP